MFPKFRKSAAVVLTTALAASTILSASAASTTKNLSSNFTLVNLESGVNTGQIQYIKSKADGGGTWRDAEQFTFTTLGDQLIKRQYDDPELPAGSGSVVVSTEGPVGAVVQIQARGQTPTSGAYVGVSEGAAEASVPLVMRRLNTASGLGNSQIIIQNASSIQIDVEVILISSVDGATTLTKSFPDIDPNVSVEYDLDTEGGLPEGWYGSATIRSTTPGGEVAVVSNLFSGGDAMQTFNAFTASKTQWGVPLFASRLANSLSTPIAVQNKSGSPIPANGVTVTCTKDPNSPGDASFSKTNTTAIGNNASYFFNPVIDLGIPNAWYGACNVDAGSFETAVFVQMRVVNGDRAAAYEGIPGDSNKQRVVIPLYAKRLANGFASAVTILNQSKTSPANVTLVYKGGTGLPSNCSSNFEATIPAGGSLIQNHRVANDVAGAVPQIADDCFGTLTVTSSNEAIDAFVQLDTLTEASGDPFMAHTAFTLAAQ